jgi:hypothetical protein
VCKYGVYVVNITLLYSTRSDGYYYNICPDKARGRQEQSEVPRSALNDFLSVRSTLYYDWMSIQRCFTGNKAFDDYSEKPANGGSISSSGPSLLGQRTSTLPNQGRMKQLPLQLRLDDNGQSFGSRKWTAPRSPAVQITTKSPHRRRRRIPPLP